MDDIQFQEDLLQMPTQREAGKQVSFFTRLVFFLSGDEIKSERAAQQVLMYVAVIAFLFAAAIFISDMPVTPNSTGTLSPPQGAVQ